jgi:hypothetical protein
MEVSTWENNGSICEDYTLDETEDLGTAVANKPAVSAPDDW